MPDDVYILKVTGFWYTRNNKRTCSWMWPATIPFHVQPPCYSVLVAPGDPSDFRAIATPANTFGTIDFNKS